MAKEFYNVPVPFGKILERKEINKCDLQSSIAQRIHLLLVSDFGESRYNPQFGCIIWDYDFENLSNQNAWKEMIIREIDETLKINEPRLKNITVNVKIGQQEFFDNKTPDIKRIKKRLDVSISGYLYKTNELFEYLEIMYISPISFD